MKRKYILLLSLAFIFLACEKEELPVPPHNPGDVQTASVNMGNDYRWQVYFDLETNAVVGKTLKDSWDLAFENNEEGNKIYLNSSKLMAIYNTETTNFEAVTDTSGFAANQAFDAASANPDSTAIGNWQNNNPVYIIDRGYNKNGIHQGFQKIQFLEVNQEKYIIRFAELSGEGETNLEIIKNEEYNYSFLSFTTGNTLIVEPPKVDWDIAFTQYTHLFYEPEFTPYLVTGCLINRFNTTVAVDKEAQFESIKFADIESHIFSNAANAIGFNWKEFTGSTYITNSGINYIIKDSDEFYYKLKFIDFYSESGEKGNPVFEFQKL